MREELNIIFEEYDDKHYIVFLERGDKNLFLDFGFCNFENEMEYWDMPTKLINFKDKEGFLFDNNIDRWELKEEIKRFAKHNNI